MIQISWNHAHHDTSNTSALVCQPALKVSASSKLGPCSLYISLYYRIPSPTTSSWPYLLILQFPEQNTTPADLLAASYPNTMNEFLVGIFRIATFEPRELEKMDHSIRGGDEGINEDDEMACRVWMQSACERQRDEGLWELGNGRRCKRRCGGLGMNIWIVLRGLCSRDRLGFRDRIIFEICEAEKLLSFEASSIRPQRGICRSPDL